MMNPGAILVTWLLMIVTIASSTSSSSSSSHDQLLRAALRLKQDLKSSTSDRFSTVSNPLLRQLHTEAALAEATSGTGRRVRLQGGAGPWEGMVEVFEGGWRRVTAQRWTQSEAGVVCRQLGYRSYFSSSPGLLHSEGKSIVSSDDFSISQCDTGLESSLLRCRRAPADQLTDNRQVGVVCLTSEDLTSRCRPGELPFGEHCYYFSEVAETRLKAEWMCSQRDAKLAAVTSQLQHDFLSGVMESRQLSGLHTSGLGHVLKFGATVWSWEGHKDKTFSFNRWEREGDSNTPAGVVDKQRCLTLQQTTQPDNSRYSLWMNSDCRSRLPAVCQRPYSFADCASGYAGEYTGNVSTGASGTPCLKWSAVTKLSIISSLALPENLCRNPDGDSGPWCFTSPETYELCDVTPCPPLLPPPEASSSEPCGALEFHCGDKQCVSLRYLCDSDSDCSNYRDEVVCAALGASFKDIPRKSILLNLEQPNSVATKLDRFKKPACQAACLIDPSCQVSVITSDDCILFTAPLSELTLIPSLTSSVSVALSRQPRCDGFLCEDFTCTNKSTAYCDRQNDCRDFSDELNCSTPVEIRLVDGAGPHIGRLEAQVQGRWGAVCHDVFSVTTGSVACRQLGFQRMRRFWVGGRGSPPRQDQFFSVSVSACNGNATNLGECLLIQDPERCVPGEHVTLECTNDSGSCTFYRNALQCLDRSRCISDSALCDGSRDCDDGSDESSDVCPPTRFALKGQPGSQTVEGKLPSSATVNISSQFISEVAANFLCREVGGGAEFGYASEDPRLLPVTKKVGSLVCRGQGSNTTCQLNYRSPVVREHALGLQCLQQRPPPPQLRLSSSSVPAVGLLEIKPPLAGWGRVCAHSFTAAQAQVACRQLGFSGPSDFQESARSTDTPIALRAMDCRGDEQGVEDCLRHPWSDDDSIEACEGGGEVKLRCGDAVRPATVGQVAPSCLRGPASLERVLGGTDALPEQQPWYVQVQIAVGVARKWTLKCGGSLISDRFVLTAQHCVRPERLSRDASGATILQSDSVDIDRLRVVTRTGQARLALRVHLHRAHRLLVPFHNDIALVELMQSATLSALVKPVCLPPTTLDHGAGLRCSTSGRGRTSSGLFSSTPDTLQVAEISLISDEQCVEAYGRQNVTLGMVCAAAADFSMDTCDGDSGGPLSCQLGGDTALVGVTSWGEGCGRAKRPGVYTRVAAYVPWIVGTVTSNST